MALARYFSILDGEARPRFHQAKAFMVDFDPSSDIMDMWQTHDDAMAAFRNGKPGDGALGTSLLDLKLAITVRMLDACNLCERKCGVNRNRGQRGHCNVLEARIASEFMHHGEEPELVPSYTIFFSGCTFECVFCQNHDISQFASAGEHFSPPTVAAMIARRRGARNVNWVGGDPTSNLPFILEVLAHTDAPIPQVWNSNMYLTEEAMGLLDGLIDVILTDFKYGNDRCASRLSKVGNYRDAVTRNHVLAGEQAELIVRHLVMPNHVDCCTKPVLNWLAENLPDARVNVMAQYRPTYQASEYPDINRPLRTIEFLEAREHAMDLGLDLVE